MYVYIYIYILGAQLGEYTGQVRSYDVWVEEHGLPNGVIN